MAKNDDKVKELLSVIEKKKNEIGAKPKAAWKSNGIFKQGDGSHVNINTVNDIAKCVDVLAHLLKEQTFRKQASEMLGMEYSDPSVEDYIHDYKLRASMVKWDNEKKKLDILEGKLKDLRSEDAKTEDAISAILQALQ